MMDAIRAIRKENRRFELSVAHNDKEYGAFYIGGAVGMSGCGIGMLLHKYSKTDRKFRNNGICLLLVSLVYFIVGQKMITDADKRISEIENEEA